MNVRRLRPEDFSLLLQSRSDGLTPFQHPAWLEHQVRTIRSAQDASLAFTLADGTLVALPMLRIDRRLAGTSYWSVAHDETGGLIGTRALTRGEREAIYGYLVQAHRPIRLSLGLHSAGADDWTPPSPWQTDVQSTHVLDLPRDYDEWFNDIADGACRRNIRRAEKSQLTISRSGSPEDIQAYLHLSARQAERRRNPIPTLTRCTTESLLACAIARLTVVYCNRQPAAGLITLESRRETMYYLGASDPACSEVRPSDFGLAAIIAASIQDGRRWLNLGGSRGSQSLERFKEKFGARKHTYPTHFVPDGWSVARRWCRYYWSRVKYAIANGDDGRDR